MVSEKPLPRVYDSLQRTPDDMGEKIGTHPQSMPGLKMSDHTEENSFIPSSIEMGVEHWQEGIAFLEDRLSGKQGNIDDEDRDTCLEALEIARENLADAKRHLGNT